MTQCRVSAIVPTYGRASSLKELLRALRRQTLPPHEILLVDQNPPGYLRSTLGVDIEAARVVQLEVPNASTARNAGMAASTGDVLLFVDDDLLPEPSLVERALQRFVTYPELGVLCPVVVSQPCPRDSMLGSLRKKRLRQHSRAPALWSVSDTISAAMFFRRDTYLAAGGFDELLFSYAGTGEDQELCWRMGKRGLDVWIDTELDIYHDEAVPGGCELRVTPYWNARRRCLKSIALRARLHNHGRISLGDAFLLARSAFLNSTILRHPPNRALTNARLLIEAMVESGRLLAANGMSTPDVYSTDYVLRHVNAREPAGSQEEVTCL